MKIAVYPGTFDPVTLGHLDLIKRASRIFDRVVVAVSKSGYKLPLFSVKERVLMLKKVTADIKNVTVEGFDGLVVDYVKSKKSAVVIRGIRMISDFEYEFQMALTNRKLNPGIETMFLMPHEAYSYVSSHLIKEAASLGANLRDFVPGLVEKGLRKKYGSHRGSKRKG